MTGPLPLGRVVATPLALEIILGAGGDPFSYVARHASGDWTGATSAPPTAARTRSRYAMDTGSSAPTTPRRGEYGSSRRRTGP